MARPSKSEAELQAATRDSTTRIANLAESTRRRKQESRDLLMSAGVKKFCSEGYYAVSVDDILSAAGVSRMTFYRHFRSKADLLGEIHQRGIDVALPRFLKIKQCDFRDPAEVHAWIAGQFEIHKAHSQLLLAYAQAAKVEREFIERAQALISRLIDDLGEAIPAFAVRLEDGPAARLRWHEAWLLLYEIFDQSNQAALDWGVAGNAEVLDILTARFIGFVEKYP